MGNKTKYWSMAQRQFWERDGVITAMWPLTINYLCGRTGVGLRGWKQAIANHSNATTPMTGTNCETVEYLPGNVSVSYQTPGMPRTTFKVRGWMSRPNVLYSPQALSYESIDNQAKARFYAQIEEATSKFQGGEFFGEIRETVRMLKRPFSAIRDHLNRYLDHVLGYVNGKPVPIRHRPRGKRKISSFRNYDQAEKLRVIGQTWLEWRFGMRPFVKDVEEILVGLGNIITEDVVVPVFAQAKSEISNYMSSSTPELYNNHIRTIRTEKATGTVVVRYKGAVVVKGTDPGILGFLRDRSNLDFGHFIPTLWELCPYSWLVDYLANVQQVIQSIFVDLRPLAWYCRTIRRQIFHDIGGTTDHALMKAYLGSSYQGSFGVPGFTRIAVTHVIRDVPSLGMVHLELKTPDFPIQFMNMGALLLKSQAVSRKLNSMSV